MSCSFLLRDDCLKVRTPRGRFSQEGSRIGWKRDWKWFFCKRCCDGSCLAHCGRETNPLLLHIALCANHGEFSFAFENIGEAHIDRRAKLALSQRSDLPGYKLTICLCFASSSQNGFCTH